MAVAEALKAGGTSHCLTFHAACDPCQTAEVRQILTPPRLPQQYPSHSSVTWSDYLFLQLAQKNGSSNSAAGESDALAEYHGTIRVAAAPAAGTAGVAVSRLVTCSSVPSSPVRISTARPCTKGFAMGSCGVDGPTERAPTMSTTKDTVNVKARGFRGMRFAFCGHDY